MAFPGSPSATAADGSAAAPSAESASGTSEACAGPLSCCCCCCCILAFEVPWVDAYRQAMPAQVADESSHGLCRQHAECSWTPLVHVQQQQRTAVVAQAMSSRTVGACSACRERAGARQVWRLAGQVCGTVVAEPALVAILAVPLHVVVADAGRLPLLPLLQPRSPAVCCMLTRLAEVCMLHDTLCVWSASNTDHRAAGSMPSSSIAWTSYRWTLCFEEGRHACQLRHLGAFEDA